MVKSNNKPDLVKVLNSREASILGDSLVGLARSESVPDVVSNSAAKDDDVKERVGTETVSAVDGHTSCFTSSVETGDNLVLAVLIDSDDLTSILGGNTTH